ncbi:MAG: alpha/beta hydrolase [Oscillospiraceae bacterium]|nr:alpha/beta hydrolase [Oscillospiraceae bacterium]
MKRTFVSAIREIRDTYRPNRYALKPRLIRDSKRHPVAIICPGGGYRRVCSFLEGEPYAKKLNRMGYHAVIVYYRVKDLARFPAPQDDLARAVGEVFENADRWNLDTNCYSIWGSSAGGHLAASFGTEAMGYAKYGLPKPGAVILTYPVVTMGEKTHPGSRNFLLGPAPSGDLITLTSVEQQITPSYPPTFLWWGDADGTVDPDNSRMLLSALERNGIPCVHREYHGVDHGIGIGKGFACYGWFEEAVAFWESQME